VGAHAIRRAGVEDAEIVATLNAAVQSLHADAHPDVFKPVDLPGATAAFRAWLADPAWYFMLVVDDDGAPTGYVGAHVIEYPENPFMPGRAFLRLDQMAVLPECEGRGYGRALVRAVVDLARTLGIEEVQLSVWAFNERAQRLYQREGFQTTRLEMVLKVDSLALKKVE
jgi:diamine N-acetyltransferase